MAGIFLTFGYATMGRTVSFGNALEMFAGSTFRKESQFPDLVIHFFEIFILQLKSYQSCQNIFSGHKMRLHTQVNAFHGKNLKSNTRVES